MEATENDIALLALHLTPGLGGQTIRQLISHAGSAHAVFRKPGPWLERIPGIGKSRQALIDTKSLNRAEKEWHKAVTSGVRVVHYLQPEYPKRLLSCYDAPAVLFVKGNARLNADRVVAVVGTRNASIYGIEKTGELVGALSPYKPVIVSGLAYGIDITAHESSLTNNVETWAVMAGGMHKIYPSSHTSISDRISATGNLVTEYPIDEMPEPGKFPARNRIIAGLCDAVIVMEAARKGGALITADIANSYHREVFALPGSLGRRYSEGCNQLIRDHEAHIINHFDIIPSVLQWGKRTESTTVDRLSELNGDEYKICSILSEREEQELDALSWKSGIALNRLAALLLDLEFRGYVKSLPGKRFKWAA